MPADADTDLYEYGGGRVIACAVIFLVICTLTLALRFYAHWLDRRPNRLEDWILLPAWLLLVGLCINVIIGESVPVARPPSCYGSVDRYLY